jgi:hypothetical protein
MILLVSRDVEGWRARESPSVSSRYAPSYTEAERITRCDAIMKAIRGDGKQVEVPEVIFRRFARPLPELRIFPVPT